MSNRFGIRLYAAELGGAAAEHVSENVIAAVLMLHERSVDEVVSQLSASELGRALEGRIGWFR
jgi:hypothetical protein